MAVLLNSKHGFVYDVQHAIGPEPERVESVAMRIRRPDGMRAVVFWGGENLSFNRAIVRDMSGWGTLNLTDFKRWCGFEIYRKTRAVTTRTKVTTQKLKDTMR
ncbi:MAG TPA: hypothetical protein VLT90_13130 [Terriglobales bacterium]|nr:hypothetical protein [Terriglobales bacterium]